MVVGIRMLSTLIWETADSNVLVKQNTGSLIATLVQHEKKSNLWEVVCIFVKLYTQTYWKD
jgi:hypothetical protein